MDYEGVTNCSCRKLGVILVGILQRIYFCNSGLLILLRWLCFSWVGYFRKKWGKSHKQAPSWIQWNIQKQFGFYSYVNKHGKIWSRETYHQRSILKNFPPLKAYYKNCNLSVLYRPWRKRKIHYMCNLKTLGMKKPKLFLLFSATPLKYQLQ